MSKPLALYNDKDVAVARWLGELIARGHVAPGVIDTRSIEDIFPNDLNGFSQVHFFSGIGGWSYALRLAGWPDNFPVWTASCPCQPFSQAGKGKGVADDRHLWPALFWHIQRHRPAVIFGEQVAGTDGINWLDIVSTDLEGEGYTVGKAVLPACGIGAPQMRPRLFWVAYLPSKRLNELGISKRSEGERLTQADRRCKIGSMANTTGTQRERQGIPRDDGRHRKNGGLGDGDGDGSRWQCRAIPVKENESEGTGEIYRVVCDGAFPAGATHGFWSDVEWLLCRDEKVRPVRPGSFPLAHGLPSRVVRVRGYGNAIVPQLAATFIGSFMDFLNQPPQGRANE